jgi:Spy/CpxP family protein refolding chaperone
MAGPGEEIPRLASTHALDLAFIAMLSTLSGDIAMKPVLRLALLGFALAIAGTGIAVAQAVQDTATSSDSSTTKHAHQAPDPQRQTARLSRKLQLTPEQAAKIEPILQSRMQQMQQLRADTTLAPGDRRAKMRALMQDSNTQLQAVLTDSQKQQYQQMQQQAMQHRQDKKSSSDDDSDKQ